MGARRFAPGTASFLQEDVYDDALNDLGLSLDPLTQNRYSLAGGNPISFVEVDGHMLARDGGGGGSSTPKPEEEADAPLGLGQQRPLADDGAVERRRVGRRLPARAERVPARQRGPCGRAGRQGTRCRRGAQEGRGRRRRRPGRLRPRRARRRGLRARSRRRGRRRERGAVRRRGQRGGGGIWRSRRPCPSRATPSPAGRLAYKGAKAGNKVYRGMAPGEDAAKGCTARNPNAGNDVKSHVAGRRDSQWMIDDQGSERRPREVR